MTKLYEVSNQFKELEVLAEHENLPAEALQDTFEGLQGQFEEKATALISVVQNMDADVEMLDKEIKRLQLRKKAVTNKQESMRTYLRENMVATGIKKIECPLFNITCSDSTEIVVIEDESSIPDEYVEVSVVQKIDKAAIKKTLKAGGEVAGARLEKGKAKLTIR